MVRCKILDLDECQRGDHSCDRQHASCMNTEGSFTWVSGSSGTFRNFRDGEPNAFTTTEDCAAMYLQLGTWNDDECTKQFVGVCEFNPQGS